MVSELNELSGTLDAVEAAMARLDDGTYGTCEVCASAIDDQRLEIDATALRCTTCALTRNDD
jgi:RNA polymerase-binding transcription factor DksA